ncbi:MAG: hypothetical protein O9296_05555 [Novosphingobium sp.]|nr:hypothetical protein [Novosphingobium sp.]
MTSQTTNSSSPDIREHAVWLMPDQEAGHSSHWDASTSIAARIGCT